MLIYSSSVWSRQARHSWARSRARQAAPSGAPLAEATARKLRQAIGCCTGWSRDSPAPAEAGFADRAGSSAPPPPARPSPRGRRPVNGAPSTAPRQSHRRNAAAAACAALSPRNQTAVLQDCWRGADPLPGRDEQIHRIDPFVQRNMRPLHDSAGANREVFLALTATVIAALAGRDPVAQTADRAARAVRPEAAFQPQPTGFRVGNHPENLVRGNGALAHTDPLDYTPIIARKSRGVKYIIPKFYGNTVHRQGMLAEASGTRRNGRRKVQV